MWIGEERRGNERGLGEETRRGDMRAEETREGDMEGR